MAPRKATKRPIKRSTKRPISRKAPSDSQTMLITSYFEITNQQDASGNDDKKLNYSIKCDPRHPSLLLAENAVAANEEGTSVSSGDGGLLVTAGNSSADLAFTRFAQFAPLYRQYRINSVKVEALVDRECGLENSVNFSTDKADATPPPNMGAIVGGAHKQLVMTESRRVAKYGWKPKDSADKDFRNMTQELADNDAHFIKVFQDIDKKEKGKCTHRVTVTMSVTLKDSTGTKLTLN